MQVDLGEAVVKAQRVYASCKTVQQLQVANRYELLLLRQTLTLPGGVWIYDAISSILRPAFYTALSRL